MNKVVLKSALITIAALIAAALIVFIAWLAISPQSMATVCEKTGNYSFATTCAEIKYNRSKNPADLLRCAEDSILSEKDEHIIKYCTLLVDHPDFLKLCEEKDEAFSGIKYGDLTGVYRDYICGHLSMANYRSGNIQGAVDAASKGSVQSFVKIIVAIYDTADKPSAQEVIPALEKIDRTQLDKEQAELVKNLIEILETLVKS